MSGQVVVTGASGMLGGAVLRELLARGENAKGWAHAVTAAPDGVEFIPSDLRTVGTWKTVPRALREAKLVIHCAAMTNADACEMAPDEARQLNAYVPGYLAAAAALVDARFVQISTDAVYDDDQAGRRTEYERTRPRSVYARTKLMGEGKVLSVHPEALVLRTTMFGWTLPTAPRRKFAEEILDALSARREMRLFQDACFSPLHVGDLATAILDLVARGASGILNLGAHRPITKYDFGLLIAETFGLESGFLTPARVADLELPAHRTKNVGLDVRAAEALVGPLPSVEAGVRRLYREAFDGTAALLKGEVPLR